MLMKVLLIQPPFNKAMFGIGHLEPLGFEIIAASIKPRHDVVFLDMPIDHYLNATLEKVRPDVVGITALTVQASTAKQVAQEVKKYDPKIFIVVGGHHASMIPEDFNIPEINAIILNHGYICFPALLENLENGSDLRKVPGLALTGRSGLYFSPQQQIRTIEDMPLPDRSIALKYRKRYHIFNEGPYALISSAIGCPYHCTFCACWKITNARYYVRTPESVVDELAIVDETRIMFADDNTFQDVKRALKIYDLIKARCIRKKYIVYARSDTIAKHPEVIEAWSEIGLDKIVIGFEVISDDDLKKFNKQNTLENNEKTIAILKKNGVLNIAHFLIRQDFNINDFDELRRYVDKHDIWMPIFPVLTPLPGTDLWTEEKHRLLTDTFDLFDLFHSVLPTRLPLRQFLSEIETLYLHNYSIWRYIKKRLWQLLQIIKGRKIEKETGEILPLLPLIVLNRTFRVALKKTRRNHLVYLKNR